MATQTSGTARRALGPGSKGPDVVELQRRLAGQVTDPPPADGLYDERTQRAVAEFQGAHGLPADGLVGPATWAALEAAPPPRMQKEAPPRMQKQAPSRVQKQAPSKPPPVPRSEPVDALALARQLAPDVELPAPRADAERVPPEEWRGRAEPLFDRRRVRRVDDRLLLAGLALLEPELGRELWGRGPLEDTAGLRDLLTRDGRARADRLEERIAPKNAAAPTLLDRPAVEDELGRRAFAVALAARLVQLRGTYEPRDRVARAKLSARVAATRASARLRVRVSGRPDRHVQPDGPFLVHLHGTWGAGKTSLLNFFGDQLERPGEELHEAVWGPEFASAPKVRPWVVVTFNAWQHQRVAPPWWWLMTTVANEAARRLALHRRFVFRLRDYAWRVRCRWPAFVIPALGLVAIVSSVWLVATKTAWFDIGEGETWYAHVGAVASALGAAVAFGVTLWSGIGAVRRWVLVGTARGAEALLTTASDPMAFVQRRYDHLVRTLGRPLAVVIDDLDRCKSAHVVELLEGIHTLFGGTAATYVVAADHAWLRECFAQEYEPFARADGDPGRPLGYRFLEKTFQLSTSLPRLDLDTRKRYLETLLRPAGAGEPERRDEARTAARTEARTLASEQEIRAAYEQSRAKSPVHREAIREALVLRAAGADILQQTEYLLADFAHLLEPNPRAMKRLVNAYGFEVKLQLLEQDTVETDVDATRRLALWTIAGLRWPTLTDFLVQHPELVERITGRFRPDGIPDAVLPLFTDGEVRRVFAGEGVGVSLDVEHLRALARLPAA